MNINVSQSSVVMKQMDFTVLLHLKFTTASDFDFEIFDEPTLLKCRKSQS